MPRTPGRIPSVTHARVTNEPIRVRSFTRSPVRMPCCLASAVEIHSGLLCEIS